MNKYVKSRVSYIKSLAENLNAEYYYGIDRVKNRFNIKVKDGISDSNVIVGNRDGYDFCFVEYYRTRKHSRWESKLFLRMKYDLPDFMLMTKESASFQLRFQAIFSGAFILIPIIGFINVIAQKGWSSSLIPAACVILLFVGIGLWLLKDFFKYYKKINNQRLFDISHNKFRDTYVIISDANPNSIRRIFNEKVCSDFVDNPLDNDLIISNKCTSLNFKMDEKLSLISCNDNLDLLLKKVKVFEKADFF